MAANRSMFYGFGAWVGHVTGRTTCKWWPEDPSTLQPPFDPAKLIEVDLAKNPRAVRGGAIQLAALQVDDGPHDGGATRLGPTFPAGAMTQGCWLYSEVYDKLATKPARVPSYLRCRDYELATVLYWAGPLANRRFWGFHAKIHDDKNGEALVSIWHAGTSQDVGAAPAGAWWLNLANVAHPIENGLTQIGIGQGEPREGALFLDAPTARSLSLREAKIPKGSGSNGFGRTR